MGWKFGKEKEISSPSSSSSDEQADPDYNGSPPKRMRQNSSSSIYRSKSLRISMEGKKRACPPPRRAAHEELALSVRRSMRRTSNNTENDQRHVKRTIISWLIETKTIQENMKIWYMNENMEMALKEGMLTRDGILCGCCDQIFTSVGFQGHAWSDLKRPYENIVVEGSRISLLCCMRDAWKRVEKIGGRRLKKFESKCSSSDRHDDACILCADGGNLLCCETCPSTYHQDCLDMEVVPDGAWLCPYCLCKFCGDPCGANDYLVTCYQCEKRYHWECYQERNLEPVDINSSFTPFCEQSCKEVYEKLEKMVGVRKELDEGFSWTLLRRMDQQFGICLNDSYQIIECHSKLAVARSVMGECFERIIDRHTKTNILQNVVFNQQSTYTRINFRGFYTAILEKDDEIISAASLRIHGTKLAEMPFIGTRENHRSQGMCRRLMMALESALCYLRVENLVIPSIQEQIGSWVQGYNFQRISPSLNNYLRQCNTLTFYDSFRLQKTLASCEAREVHEAEDNRHQNGPESERNSPVEGLFDLNSEPLEEGEMNEDGDITSNNTSRD